MKFSEIIRILSDVLISWKANGDPEVFDVEIHSSKVKNGDVFVCRKGDFFDSHEVAREVVERGAKILVCEREIENTGVPTIVVSDSRVAEALLAAEFYGKPYEKLLVFGVTGTNGKTTTIRMVHFMLSQLKIPGSVVSTVGNDIMGREEKTYNTTPNALYLMRVMRETVEKGGKFIALEVSSHAIAQKRIYSIEFDSAALLNITRDHLDFHKSFDEYKRVKFSIFKYLKPDGVGVISYEFFNELNKGRFRKVFFGDGGKYRVKNIDVSFSGTKFKLETPWGVKNVKVPMVGEFNAYNAAAALIMLSEIGFDIDELIGILRRFPGVDGRFEVHKEALKQGIRVVVDFAHSPDALEKVLKTGRKLLEGKGRIIIVFGAGGMSDKGKREIMGRVASELADVAIVTNDDPRGEDPEEIIEDILKGFPKGKQPLVIIDRKEAIETALTLASRKDIIIIAGRGHEDMQVLAPDREVPFKDREVVWELLQKKIAKRR
ncbi:MAG: UDP-N-acetylmuramoyl-L-alanyl-D-glutamate--2,6-diaminopimelate ligase [Thermotogaceae bacterium]|nr:UDP-N-acetylmuramoyl-L-alanyl-D-glutamate--2,6-diaminopimelate ligase [Thermotogaceae bacterium]